MKKLSLTIASLALVAFLSGAAFAAGPGHPGPGYGHGYAYQNLTPEQQAELQKARAAFLNDTLKLRQDLAAKRAEMVTLTAQPGYDKAKARALADQMVDLRAQIAKKHNEHFAGLPYGLMGAGMGRGMGHGMGTKGGACMGAGMMGGGAY